MTDTEIKRDGQLAEIALGNLGAQIALLGYSGTKRNPTGGAVVSTGNAVLLIKPGAAGVPAIDAKTSAGAQTFLVNDTAITMGVLLIVPTIGPNSTQQHTVPAVASDTLALLAATQTLTNKTLTAAVLGGTTNVSGGQLQFPATQSASAGANVLDDYEESTWTPANGNATFTSRTGNYIKIGRMVTVWGNVVIANINAGSSSVISGLPFQADLTASGVVDFWGSTAGTWVFIACEVQNGTSTVTLTGATAAVATTGTATAMGNGTTIQFQCTYRTAS